MALGLKDLLREPAPFREEGINLCHCEQQPGRNCGSWGWSEDKERGLLRVEEAAENSKTIWCKTKKKKNRAYVCACIRALARVHWVLLGSWMLPLLAQHLLACVRTERTPSIPATPYLSLGWANKSRARILRSHNLRSSSVMELLATPFVSKPGNGFLRLQPARM